LLVNVPSAHSAWPYIIHKTVVATRTYNCYEYSPLELKVVSYPFYKLDTL